MYTLNETIAIIRNLGKVKVNKRFNEKLILSFVAGAAVAFGYLASLKSQSIVPGGIGTVIGALVFPIGLMIVLIPGGELLTGNMMVVGTSYLHKDVSLTDLIKNWLTILFGNFLGSIFVAYFFVVYLETVEPSFLTTAVNSKLDPTYMQMLVSGVACNIFVGLSVWIYQQSKDNFLKFMAIWFPIMVFVILGFQHVVANMFLLAVPLMLNTISLMQYITNIIFVFIGNAIGGVVFVGLVYSLAAGSLKD